MRTRYPPSEAMRSACAVMFLVTPHHSWSTITAGAVFSPRSYPGTAASPKVILSMTTVSARERAACSETRLASDGPTSTRRRRWRAAADWTTRGNLRSVGVRPRGARIRGTHARERARALPSAMASIDDAPPRQSPRAAAPTSRPEPRTSSQSPRTPTPGAGLARKIFALVVGGSSTTVRLDLHRPTMRRRRDANTDYNGWGGVDSRVAYEKRHNLSIDGVRCKVMQKWEGGGFVNVVRADCGAERKPRLDLGVGVDVSLMRSDQPVTPECRLKIRTAGNHLAPVVFLRAAPEPEIAARARVPILGTGVFACVETVFSFRHLDKGPRGIMVTARLVRPAGTGAHLSTTGVEFDETLLRVGDAFALRLAASLDVPRGVGVGDGGVRSMDGAPTRLRVEKLGVKKKMCWWKMRDRE